MFYFQKCVFKGKELKQRGGAINFGVVEIEQNLLQFCGTDENEKNAGKESENYIKAFPSRGQSHANSDNVDSLKNVFQSDFIYHILAACCNFCLFSSAHHQAVSINFRQHDDMSAGKRIVVRLFINDDQWCSVSVQMRLKCYEIGLQGELWDSLNM